MNRVRYSILSLLIILSSCSTPNSNKESGTYPYIDNPATFAAFAKTIPIDIGPTDDYKLVLSKIELFLKQYEPISKEDYYSYQANIQALEGCKNGSYGIGAVLVDKNGTIVEKAYNVQPIRQRSDLHGEMNLLTKYENNSKNRIHQNGYILKPGFTVFSSAEPCPMCMIRLASAGVNTKFNCQNESDSFSHRIDVLPTYWRRLCEKYPSTKAACSAQMSKVAYLLFYTWIYMGDNNNLLTIMK